MPLQGSWVEHWLDRFCEPGTHEFLPLTDTVVWCVRCGKKELSEGMTCFFCDIPGSSNVRVQHYDSELPPRETMLCVLCYEELERQQVIRGWSVAS